MAFEKGDPKPPGSGRKKGTPNKHTKAVKDALRDALEAAHDGGAEGYFLALAQTDPKVFASLVGKLIPNEITGKVDGVPMLVLDQDFVTGNVQEVADDDGET